MVVSNFEYTTCEFSSRCLRFTRYFFDYVILKRLLPPILNPFCFRLVCLLNSLLLFLVNFHSLSSLFLSSFLLIFLHHVLVFIMSGLTYFGSFALVLIRLFCLRPVPLFISGFFYNFLLLLPILVLLAL